MRAQAIDQPGPRIGKEAMEDGIVRAAEIIDSGAALAKLDALIACSQQFAAVSQ